MSSGCAPRDDLLAALGAAALPIRVAAVCVYPDLMSAAARALSDSGIPVTSVAVGFPANLAPFELRVKEIEYTIEIGAQEIDVVIFHRHALQGDPGDGRAGPAALGLSGQPGVHDGRRGLHQDLNGQSSGQRDAGGRAGDVLGDPHALNDDAIAWKGGRLR